MAAPSSTLFVEFTATTVVGKTNFDIQLGYRTINSKRYLHGRLSSKEGIGLPELIHAFSPDAEIPGFLESVPKVYAFYIEYGGEQASKTFTIGLESKLKIENRELDLLLQFSSVEDKGKVTTRFKGQLRIGQHTFRVSFQGEKDNSFLFAKYDLQDKLTLNFRDFAKALLGENTQFPELKLDIRNPNVFFVWNKQKTQSKFLVGLGAGLGENFSLDGLPLVGSLLNDPAVFRIEEVLVMYAKGTFSEKEIKALNKKLAVDFPGKHLLPEASLTAGFNFSTTLRMMGEESVVSLSNLASVESSAVTEVTVTPVQDSIPANLDTPKATWKDVDKQLGPVKLQRVGFSYEKGKLILLLDASMKLAGLDAQLVGLGLGIEVKWPPSWPSVYLSGLGLAYTSPSLSISGMFLRAAPKDNEQYSYSGAAGITTSAFSISGMGSYARLKNGADSFFAYFMFQGQLGGPAFFFVTGVALGFGINRRVRVPKIHEVKDFPLVAMALNPDPKKTLNQILTDLVARDWIPSSSGDYWLAVGLRFTSFKIVDSFVMLIVGFGNRLEVSILGLSLLAWPNKSSPIVYIELQLLAHFATDCDILSVEGLLTPNSYILDRNCRLTGGFAFYVWVSGPNEGDFVITMGGYHPRYKVPAHYPKVDRLGLSWRIGPLTILGEMYFALTPRCIMLGGKLVAEYRLSFLQVSFTYWFDAYISWAPFQYDLSGGARLQISLTLKVLGIRIHYSLSISATVQIYGPPFGGRISVDLGFYEFTIPFGESQNRRALPIDWTNSSSERPGFLESFVPTKGAVKQPLESRIAGGIIDVKKDAQGNVQRYLVNAYDLVMTLDSFFPATEIVTENKQTMIGDTTLMVVAGEDAPRRYKDREKRFGILPMGVVTVTSTLSFCLKKDGSCIEKALVVMAHSKGITRALWAQEDQRDGPTILKYTATGLEIHATESTDTAWTEVTPSVNRKEKSVELTFFRNGDGGSRNPEKTAHLEPAKAGNILQFFNSTGFALEPWDVTESTDLGIHPPLFAVNVGQKLPKKIT